MVWIRPSRHLTEVFASSCIDFTRRTVFSVSPVLLKLQPTASLGTLSKAFSRSTKVQYLLLFNSDIFSCTCLSKNTANKTPFTQNKPNWLFIHSFIHSGHFYSAPSSPLLLRGAPDYSTDTVS